MRIVVTGSGGFIGNHLCAYLKEQGHWVRGIDIKYPEYNRSSTDEFIIQDLRYPCDNLFKDIDQVYHLAADMGGIGYIETHKADIVFNNTLINMLTLKACQEQKVKKFLFASSACVYPKYLQKSTQATKLKEDCAYPADSEDGYGWEKLMMERACRHFYEDYGLQTYIARFHNIYGTHGTYDGGKEKSPAALCRKVAVAKDTIELWGDGSQIRSYCFVYDCVKALTKLMESDYHKPLNIGTEEDVSINDLADMIIKISGKEITKTYNLDMPKGVHSRNADISKAKKILNWKPEVDLIHGLEKTYSWIYSQIYR